MSRFPMFDFDSLKLHKAADRPARTHRADIVPVPQWRLDTPRDTSSELARVAEAIVHARQHRRPVIAFIGGHVIKSGMGGFLVSLLRDDMITHVAMNGAAMVHDFELATIGKTSEHVAENIRDGSFGMREELRELCELAVDANLSGRGFGEAVGCWLFHRPDAAVGSVLAECHLGQAPATVHTLIGGDVFNYVGPRHFTSAYSFGEGLGGASYNDLRIFAASLAQIEGGGVFLNIGSAVTGPEIYLKCLSAVRNVAAQHGKTVTDFTTAVFDIAPLPPNWRDGEPAESSPHYYYRPLKTILLRTVADGGRSHYIQGEHARTLPALRDLLLYYRARL